MEFISSKNIFLLIKDTLGMIDEHIMDHGTKVAYFVSKMLELKGGYEKFEIADIAILATFHDIGAYKTNDFLDMKRFEYKDFMPHSIYGYLFMKYLSPLENLAKVLLYHHVDNKQLETFDFPYKELAAYINIADKMDLYTDMLGEKFDTKMLKKYADTRFSREGLELFYQAEEKYNMMEKVKSEEYKKEMDDLTDYLIFTNEEKKKYLEMLTYCVGFRSRDFVENEITSLCIVEELGEKMFLEDSQKEILYYGALLHDIGMLAIPAEIIDAPRNLTKQEVICLQTHVDKAVQVLRKNSMEEDVILVVATHHERADGTGYPRQLSDGQMTRLQKLLQIADMVTGLCHKRSYREAKNKDEIIEILTEETAKGRLNRPIVNIMITFYDEIMEKVRIESENSLKMFHKLNTNYDFVSRQFPQ